MKFFSQGNRNIINFAFQHPNKFLFILRVKRNRLSYLGLGALVDLAEGVESVEKQKLAGVIVEAGCALGGSALVLASAKRFSRQLIVFDTFESIPAPSSKDGPDAQTRYEDIQSGQSAGIKGGQYYGYIENLYDLVHRTFSTFGYPIEGHNITLVKGLFEDTLRVDGKIVLAHLDCDWYESVKTCLERIAPNLANGGRIIIDDYYDWSGCKKAVDEYFTGKKDEFQFIAKSRLHIIRKKS